jgi:hypothetical protein
MVGGAEQAGKLEQVRDPFVLLGHEGVAVGHAKAQCALAQVVAHAQQVVHLAEAARRLAGRA